MFQSYPYIHSITFLDPIDLESGQSAISDLYVPLTHILCDTYLNYVLSTRGSHGLIVARVSVDPTAAQVVL